jgi:hypothetical protein
LRWRYSFVSPVSAANESGSVASWLMERFSFVKLVSLTIGFGSVAK